MSVSNILHFDFLILLIELIGSFLLIRYVMLAIIVLIRGYRHLEHAQYLIAEGALMALNFKLAGTLLKTIELKTWQQIFTFSMILFLRTLLKGFLVGKPLKFIKNSFLPKDGSKIDQTIQNSKFKIQNYSDFQLI